MKSFRLVPLLTFLVSAFAVPQSFSQALPVYTAPTSKVGGAIAQGITQTMVRRGFAINDPRIYQTISAVSSRTAASVTAIGSGTTWLSYMGRLSPWVTAGFLVYEGYKWYTGADGTVKTEILIDPSKLSGITAGGAYWIVGGVMGSDPYSVAAQYATPTAPWVLWSRTVEGMCRLWLR